MQKGVFHDRDEVPPLGDTTDYLLENLDHTSRGEFYLAWKLEEQVKNTHFCLAEDLLTPYSVESIDQFIRQTFRDLHGSFGRDLRRRTQVTSELRDWVASLLEKLSSRIVAAVLEGPAWGWFQPSGARLQ